MSWKNRLRKASFKGLPFYIESSDSVSGRRTVVHQIPYRNLPAIPEDLGKETKQFKISGFILGSNYMGLRDKLIDLSEDKSVGTLIHPYYGRKVVKLLSTLNIKESKSEGGYCSFDLTFIEAEEEITYDILPDFVKVLLEFTTELDAVINEFIDQFYNLENQVSTTASILYNSIYSSVSAVSGLGSEFMSLVNKIVNKIDAMDTGSDLFKDYIYLIEQLPVENIQAIIEDNQPTDEDNDFIFNSKVSIQSKCITALTNKFLNTNFISKNDAISEQIYLLNLIEDLQENLNFELNNSFNKLKTNLNEYLQNNLVKLPSENSLELFQDEALLNREYDTFENFDNTDFLIDRNEILNPLFINGELEYIND